MKKQGMGRSKKDVDFCDKRVYFWQKRWKLFSDGRYVSKTVRREKYDGFGTFPCQSSLLGANRMHEIGYMFTDIIHKIEHIIGNINEKKTFQNANTTVI